MMDDILKQINAGEVSGVQFKERILDKYDIACELVAFSNSHGGKLVVGIKDKTGETNALSYSEVQETTNLLSDIASENVVPSILIKIDTVEVEDGYLIVATVKGDSRDGKLFLQQADVAVTVAKNRRRDLHTIQFDALFSHTAPPEISIEFHVYCTTKSARRKL